MVERRRDRRDQADARRHLAQRRDEDQGLLRSDRSLSVEAQQVCGEQRVDPRRLGELRHPHGRVQRGPGRIDRQVVRLRRTAGSGHGFQRPGLLHAHDSSISHRRQCHLGGTEVHGYGLAPRHGSAGRADTGCECGGCGPDMLFRPAGEDPRPRDRWWPGRADRRRPARRKGRKVRSATERGVGTAQVDVPTLRPGGSQGRGADRPQERCPHRDSLGSDVCVPDGALIRGACARCAGHAHDLPWSYAAARPPARRPSSSATRNYAPAQARSRPMAEPVLGGPHGRADHRGAITGVVRGEAG